MADHDCGEVVVKENDKIKTLCEENSHLKLTLHQHENSFSKDNVKKDSLIKPQTASSESSKAHK